MVYRSRELVAENARGLYCARDAEDGRGDGDGNGEQGRKEKEGSTQGGENMHEAAQCIWLARVRPEDCEGIIKYTVLQGKVVKPERQLRGGFDRARGVVSW